MREVFMLIGRQGALLWSDASESPSQLPDSRARWQAIWGFREELEELSHSHPLGPLDFSEEDRSTMEALEAALGRQLRFSVVAPNGIRVHEREREYTLEEAEPWWASLLRLASGMAPYPARISEKG